jgi:hypothetical protein
MCRCGAICTCKPAHAVQASVEYVTPHLEAYANVKDSKYLIESGYFGLGRPHARLQERIGDYTPIMKDHYVIKDWLPGEPRYAQVGVHGGMCAQEMYGR